MSSKDSRDLIKRGSKKPSPLGSTIFCGLRLFDIPLQHAILTRSLGIQLIETLGSKPVAQGPLANTGIQFLDQLEMSPYRLILLSMATAASVKHIAWSVYLSGEEMPPAPAGMIGGFNSAINSINTLLFVCAATSPAYGRGEGPSSSGWPGAPVVVGGTLFITGMFIETVSEVQRKLFKRSQEGADRPYAGGLFGLSRHPNYLGYTMWRTGFALSAGGWIWAACTVGAFVWDFNRRAIPVLEEYCHNKYADLWTDLTKRVPYQFMPFVY